MKQSLLMLASSARTHGASGGTDQSATFSTHTNKDWSFILSVSAKTGTAPTLDVTIQTNVNGVWVTVATFTQVTGSTTLTSTELKAVTINTSQIRANMTLGGSSTPGFTYSLVAFSKS
jgi:hypothetical protein